MSTRAFSGLGAVAAPAAAFILAFDPGLGLALGARAVEPPPIVRVMALTGAQAPHRPLGQSFVLLDAVPGGSFIDAPSIDAYGTVGFGAALSNIQDPPPFGEPFAASLWKGAGSDAFPLAVNGDPAPGFAGDFFIPSTEIGVPSLAGGNAAFSTFVGGFSPQAVFTTGRGTVEAAAASGAHPPGLGADASFVQLQGFEAESADTVIFATYATGGVNLPDNQGLWNWRGGTLALRYAKGTHAPGMPAGVTFGETAITPTRSFGELRVGADGRIVFIGWMHGPGVTTANDEGVWLEDGAGNTALVAREGTLTPGAGPGFRFAGGLDALEAFGGRASSPPPMVTEGGAVFGAALRRGSDVVSSLWARHAGAPELIARTAAPANDPGAPTPPGFPAGSRYATLPDALVDRAGNVLYRAVVSKPGGAQEAAVWSVSPGGFPLLTVRGNLPLADGGTVESVSFLGVNNNGTFAVLGRTGDLSRNVVLLCDFKGSVTRLIGPGDGVQVAQGDTRVVSTLEAGPGLSDAGAVAVRLHFADGSVAVASVGRGTTCATDFNGNGVVNSTDVSDFLNAWFDDLDHGEKGSFIADFNGDFVINSTDVSDFINAWFDDIAAGCGG
jgi:hypothetical protein